MGKMPPMTCIATNRAAVTPLCMMETLDAAYGAACPIGESEIVAPSDIRATRLYESRGGSKFAMHPRLARCTAAYAMNGAAPNFESSIPPHRTRACAPAEGVEGLAVLPWLG